MQVGPGVTLSSRYRLTHRLGRGGMADVYEATDAVLGRRVAVKVFRDPSEPDAGARQDLEIRTLAQMRHPHIVTVYDAGADGDVAYVVMQLVEGVTLAERIREGPLAPGETARIGAAVSAALAHLHDGQVIHRDVKPGNIMIAASDEVFLTDFGIVRLIGMTRLTQHGTIGTAGYLAPEQVRGEDIGTPADIYSLGLVLLECLSGTPEYPGSSAEAALARLTRAPRIPEHLPPGWAALVTSMTAADPAQRPSAHAVARLLHDLPRSAPEPPTVVLPLAAPSTVPLTAPLTVPPTGPSAGFAVPTASPAPVPAPIPAPDSAPRRPSRRRAGWAAAAAALILVPAGVWWALQPIGEGSSYAGPPEPTMAAGAERLPQDLQDLRRAVEP